MLKRNIFSFKRIITKYFRVALLPLCIWVAVASATPATHAQTCTTSWAMPVDGNWSDPTKWTHGVPIAGRDVACIGGGSFKVTVTGNQATRDLIVSAGPTVEILGHDSISAYLELVNYMNDGILQLDSLSTANAQLGMYGVLQNTGRIEINASSTSLRRISGIINNAGQIIVNQDAQFTFFNGSGTLTNSGTITVATDKTLKVSEPVIQNDGGIEPYGTFEVLGGSSFLFNGGSITGTPEGSVTLRDTHLSADGTGTGPVSIRGGGILMGNISAGVVVLIQGDQTSGYADLTARSDFINDGTIVLASLDDRNGSYLTVSGILTNRNSIVVDSTRSSEHSIRAHGIVNGIDGDPSATITINHDTIFSIGGGSDSFTNLGTIEIAPAASLTMVGIRSTLSNPEQGTIRGGGTLRLQAGTSFAGVGAADINLINNGAVHPGDSPGLPGLLEVSGAYTNMGDLNIDLQGVTPGTDYSQLDVDGAAALAGTLNLNRLDGYFPDPGDTFTVMTYGSHTGAFGGVNGLAICPTLSFQVSYTDTSVVVTAVGAPCN